MRAAPLMSPLYIWRLLQLQGAGPCGCPVIGLASREQGRTAGTGEVLAHGAAIAAPLEHWAVSPPAIMHHRKIAAIVDMDRSPRRCHRGRDRGHGAVDINGCQIAPLPVEAAERVFVHVVMLLPAMAEPIGPPYEVVLARGWTHVWASPIFAFREPARPWSQLGVGGELRPGIKLRGSRLADN